MRVNLVPMSLNDHPRVVDEAGSESDPKERPLLLEIVDQGMPFDQRSQSLDTAALFYRLAVGYRTWHYLIPRCFQVHPLRQPQIEMLEIREESLATVHTWCIILWAQEDRYHFQLMYHSSEYAHCQYRAAAAAVEPISRPHVPTKPP